MKKKSYYLLLLSFLLTSCEPLDRIKAKYFGIYDTDSTSDEKSSESTSISESNSEKISDSYSEIISESESTSESSSEFGEASSVSTYNNYYSTLIEWDNGEDLINQLHNIIHGGTYKALTFANPNYETNICADHSQSDFEMLDVIYSGTDCEVNRSGKGWQREHCYPASLMTGSITAEASKFPGRATDFHNLWAAEGSANSSRGNKNYGMADTKSSSYTNRMNTDKTEGYAFDENTFEPASSDKGIAARSIFYMATMYTETEFDSVNNVTMKGLTIVEDPVTYVSGNDCKFAIGNLSTLLSWANTIPVSIHEAQHNESVYSHVYSANGYAQGNRNPYVDFPELVDYAFGSKKNQPGRLDKLTPSIESFGDLDKHRCYSLYTAKREYDYGDTFKKSDFVVVDVKNDFTYTTYEDVSCSLINHTFSSDDGLSKEVTLIVDGETLTYTITLNPAGECNNKQEILKTYFTNTVDVTQNATIGLDPWVIRISGTDQFTMSNNNKIGGIKMGSGTKPVTSFVLKSVNSYKVDAIYIQAITCNKTSSYTLKIKVGDTIVYQSSIAYSDTAYGNYGTTLETPLEGIISFEFEGSNALGLYNFSFNVVE